MQAADRGVKRSRAPDGSDEPGLHGSMHPTASTKHMDYDPTQSTTTSSTSHAQHVAHSRSDNSASPGTAYTHTPPHPGPSSPSHGSPEANGPAVSETAGRKRSASNNTAQSTSSTSFRNVSACNRCRVRKNRCDQNLPACRPCEKAGVKCVGFDPISRREIPRSYVYFLEERATYLEQLLTANGVTFLDSEEFAVGKRTAGSANVSSASTPQVQRTADNDKAAKKENRDVERLVSDIGMVSVKGASDSRYLGSTSGISFARVVFAALKKTVSRAPSELGGTRPSKASSIAAGTDSATMRDSFFGLHTKPTIKEAPFPDKELGMKLVNLYFQHANPQIPILHRNEFMSMFERVYEDTGRKRTARESFLLNIVFAIGSAIIMGAGREKNSSKQNHSSVGKESSSSNKRQRLSNHEYQPEEYHASAIVFLESFLGSSPMADHPDGSGGGLEELQAVCLLAGFALLRPVAPGLWYIVGVAVRLAVDLGLHHEEGQDADKVSPSRRVSVVPGSEIGDSGNNSSIAASERGRREWVRDLRRRLWWSVYSFDRLVSSCVGRPFGISDQAVTTEFPSLLDDDYITPAGLTTPAQGSPTPSPKVVAYQYFRLRLLQSEILQVLQYENAQRVHASRSGDPNPYMHSHLPSPFLQNFKSFREWREDMDKRLWEWKESAPTQQDAGVDFSPLFFELNYWQAIIMLFRPSLTAPAQLAKEMRYYDSDVISPTSLPFQGNEEFVLLKIAEAGQKVLKLYRQLHRIHLINYTFLATHHLFMAGISFLYAIWHSPVVRSHLSLDDVDFTVLAATSVLGDLTEKCPPAEICRDAFDRMSKATIQMCMATTGFGPSATAKANPTQKATQSENTSQQAPTEYFAPSAPSVINEEAGYYGQQPARPLPQFDMNLRDLFSEGERPSRSSQHSLLGTSLGPGFIKQEPLSYITTQQPVQQNVTEQNSASIDVDPNLQEQPQIFTNFNSPDVQMQWDLGGLSDLDFETFSQGDGMDPNLWGFGDGDLNHDWGAGNGGVDVMNGFWFGNGGI